jgi:hypothetical protein
MNQTTTDFVSEPIAPDNSGPITVCVPSIEKERMLAIIELSRAIQHMAAALNGAFVNVEIRNCNISNANPAIEISSKPTQ